MKITNIIKTFIILTLFVQSIYALDKGVIVVSDDVDITQLSKSDLENIFLGRKTLWSNGKRIKIGLCSENSKKLNQFLIENIGQNKRRFKKYWLKKVFAGYGRAPKIFDNNDKALKFIKEQENSIAYMTVQNNKQLEGINIINIK